MTTFNAVAEPMRRQILDILLSGQRPVGYIADHLALSQPATSKHLRVLRQTGLVEVHIDAQRRLYGLRPQALEEVDAWLAPYRRLWEKRLNALKRHVETMAESEILEGGGHANS